MPSLRVPIEGGTVDLSEVKHQVASEVDGDFKLEGIAVEDSPCSEPSYQRLSSTDVQVQPGQHLYLKARYTGRNWLMNALFP
ncbi:hypothetical protein MNEG_5651 [Monoraphidium neglectum]|uniref:Uncharacterized protein n=1 Tax=Monoraphidium neglectum TaxID=145388 RepID=A0A0D2N9G8_9CHLO|nr:hypothetical protein MNEG_5651 [Monoraphidium neglectum]KIZ02306.1 hypothetical protein MNEG_5651 [Monoraphidium neglectum]|eukprot:XP_013901325.1 hypothetical protein MNEG_5651 [Monoraphidium neglectum]